jgi:hypothetical protein
MRLQLLSRMLIQGALPGALMVVLAVPPDIVAQAAVDDHIVSSQALQQRLEASSATRQQQIKTLTGFLTTPAAERAMKDAHVNPEQVRTAIPTLSDQELSNLASRAADAQQKFAAGSMTNDELLIIILIIAIVIIVVALH